MSTREGGPIAVVTEPATWLAAIADDPRGVVAVYAHGTPRTYGAPELVATAMRVASGLEAHDVRRGDRVALVCREGAEWIAADIAVQALGAVTVGLDRALIGHLAETDRFAAVVVDTDVVIDQVRGRLGAAAADTVFVVLDSSVGGAGEAVLWSALADEGGTDTDPLGRLRERARLVGPDDVATEVWQVDAFDGDGRVAAVTRQDVTHRVLLAATSDWARGLGVDEQDTLVSVLPMSVWAGRVATEVAPLAHGCRGVIYPGILPTSLPVVRPTVLVGTGPFWSAIAQSVRGRVRELAPRDEPFRRAREAFLALAAILVLVVGGLLGGPEDVCRAAGVLCAVVAAGLTVAGRVAARGHRTLQEPSPAGFLPGVLGIVALGIATRSEVWGAFFRFCFGVAVLAAVLVMVLGQLKWWNGHYWTRSDPGRPSWLRRRLWVDPIRTAYGVERCRHLLSTAPELEAADRALLATYGIAVSDQRDVVPQGGV